MSQNLSSAAVMNGALRVKWSIIRCNTCLLVLKSERMSVIKLPSATIMIYLFAER